MSRKVVIVADPGIDTAFAIALALHDPELDVVGLVPTGGNVSPEQANRNVHALIDQIDPPKWPRVAAALPINYELTGEALHGPGGLGGVEFPYAIPRQQTPADELIVEVAHADPGEVSLLVLGPPTAAAAAFGRDPELPRTLERVVLIGGTWREPGNATAPAEFHFYCDPGAARLVIQSGAAVTVIPLDVMRRLVFSPTDLMDLPNTGSRTGQFLRQIIPYGIRASANIYGVEGFHLKDVLGVVALSRPELITVREVWMDVEVAGELTRGMSVIDDRPGMAPPPNVFVGVDVDVSGVRDYVADVLRSAE